VRTPAALIHRVELGGVDPVGSQRVKDRDRKQADPEISKHPSGRAAKVCDGQAYAMKNQQIENSSVSRCLSGIEKNTRCIVRLASGTVAFASLLAMVEPAASATPRFQPEWSSLLQYEMPAWFRDGKFGIFVHWGPETLRNNGHFGQNSTLAERAAAFKGDKFNAAHWAELFRQSGAKYVVQVGEHHDAYALYDSSHTKFSSVKMLPQRDFVKELAAEVRSRGLVFGLSSHTEQYYWFSANPPKRMPPGPKPGTPIGEQPDREFLEWWYARLVEMVDKYQPQVMWFDWAIEQPGFETHLKKFASYYYNRAAEWGKGVVLNYKYEAMRPGTAVLNVSSLTARLSWKPEAAQPRPWQFDTMTSYEWFWRPNITLRPVPELLAEIIDVVSKNGNILLNYTPDPDGAFNAEQERSLREIGRWLSVNGEAIYGTRPWKVFGEGPHEGLGPNFKMPRPAYTAADVRFTAKGRTVYALMLGAAGGREVKIQSLGMKSPVQPGRIAAVSALGSTASPKWRQDDEGLHVTVPASAMSESPIALKVSLQ